jgi:hypothetical protein
LAAFRQSEPASAVRLYAANDAQAVFGPPPRKKSKKKPAVEAGLNPILF